MALLVDQNIHNAMKAVAEAIKLDTTDSNQQAYHHYLHCTQYIVQTLLCDTRQYGIQVSGNSKKFLQLGQQCMDRASAILKQLGSQQDPSLGAGTDVQSPPMTPSVQHFFPASSSSSSSAAAAPMHVAHSHRETPLEQAEKQNKQLMAAYKARLSQMKSGDKRAANLSLTLQRRLAENVAIATARQEALAKKMKERRKRLEQEAARKLSFTVGMTTKAEQERLRIYTQCLEFDQEVTWVEECRIKLRGNPEDCLLIKDIVHQVLSSNSHPLAVLMRKYQYEICDRLKPIFQPHMVQIDQVTVPYRYMEQVYKIQSALADQKPSSPTSVAGTQHHSNRTGKQNVDNIQNTENFIPPEGIEHLVVDNIEDPSEQIRTLTFEDAYRDVTDELTIAMRRGEELVKQLTLEVEEACEVATKVEVPSQVTDDEMDYLFEDIEEEDEGDGVLVTCPKQSRSSDKLQKLQSEALSNHLNLTVHDVRVRLEKLLTLFIVVFEDMNSDVGRETCFACLEETYFQTVWPFVFQLFRCVNHAREIQAAVCMTHYSTVTPEGFGVPEKFCLTVSQQDTTEADSNSPIPYKSAVEELSRIGHCLCPLSKLECLVRVSRNVLNCMEDYYSTTSDGTDKPQVPSMGADDLLPIMSYVIVKSGLPQLVSEVHALEEFIHEGYLMGEEGYCLTTVQTSLGYILSLIDKVQI